MQHIVLEMKAHIADKYLFVGAVVYVTQHRFSSENQVKKTE